MRLNHKLKHDPPPTDLARGWDLRDRTGPITSAFRGIGPRLGVGRAQMHAQMHRNSTTDGSGATGASRRDFSEGATEHSYIETGDKAVRRRGCVAVSARRRAQLSLHRIADQ